MKYKNKGIKVKYRKLGQHKVWGFSYKNKNLVEVELTSKRKMRFRILNHEILHKLCPEFSETRIRKMEKILTDTLWAQNYRQVDQ